MEFFKETQGGLLFSRRGEQVLIRPWGKNSLRVQATKNAAFSSEDWGVSLPVEECTPVIRYTEDGAEMENGEIVKAVEQYPCRMVILTGGEPGLWIDSALVDALHAAGRYVCIETNGTCRLPENIDWVTCSPKQGTSLKVAHVDEVKVVYLGQDVSAYLDIPARHYFLQPCSCQNTDEVIAYIKQHPVWRLSLQTHKLINIP